MGRKKVTPRVPTLDKVGWTIGTLQIEEGCAECLDCKHRVQYSDTKKMDIMHATKIVKLFQNAGQEIPEHFAHVLRPDFVDFATWKARSEGRVLNTLVLVNQNANQQKNN